MRKKGTIVFWNQAKGYGFIERDKDSARVFFHVSEFNGSRDKLREGETVIYKASVDKQKRPRAVDVLPEGEKLSSHRRSTKQSRRSETERTRNRKNFADACAGLIVVVFIGAMGLSIFLGKTLPVIGLLYTVMSVLTFLVYAWDKRAAQNDRWRTSEITLHLLALAGGWPGALMAQKMLRHKSGKADFRLFFWITVIANVVTFAWLHTETGMVKLNDLLSLLSIAIKGL